MYVFSIGNFMLILVLTPSRDRLFRRKETLPAEQQNSVNANLRAAVCQQGSTCTLNPGHVDSALESAGGGLILASWDGVYL